MSWKDLLTHTKPDNPISDAQVEEYIEYILKEIVSYDNIPAPESGNFIAQIRQQVAQEVNPQTTPWMQSAITDEMVVGIITKAARKLVLRYHANNHLPDLKQHTPDEIRQSLWICLPEEISAAAQAMRESRHTPLGR